MTSVSRGWSSSAHGVGGDVLERGDDVGIGCDGLHRRREGALDRAGRPGTRDRPDAARWPSPRRSCGRAGRRGPGWCRARPPSSWRPRRGRGRRRPRCSWRRAARRPACPAVAELLDDVLGAGHGPGIRRARRGRRPRAGPRSRDRPGRWLRAHRSASGQHGTARTRGPWVPPTLGGCGADLAAACTIAGTGGRDHRSRVARLAAARLGDQHRPGRDRARRVRRRRARRVHGRQVGRAPLRTVALEAGRPAVQQMQSGPSRIRSSANSPFVASIR